MADKQDPVVRISTPGVIARLEGGLKVAQVKTGSLLGKVQVHWLEHAGRSQRAVSA